MGATTGDKKLCKRCGELVDPDNYSRGVASTWVDTGPELRRTPVPCHAPVGHCGHVVHPAIVGVHEEWVQGGYWTSESVWAPGFGTGDEGCDSCRQVAVDAHEARQKREQLRSQRKELRAESDRLEPGKPPRHIVPGVTVRHLFSSLAVGLALALPLGGVLSILAWQELLPLEYVQHVHSHIDAADNPCADRPKLPESKCVESPFDAGITPFVPFLEIWAAAALLVLLWPLAGWARDQLASRRDYRARVERYEARKPSLSESDNALAAEVSQVEAKLRYLKQALTDQSHRERNGGREIDSEPATPLATVAHDGLVPDQRDRIGRNDPCWCGSGRKYKTCHGA